MNLNELGMMVGSNHELMEGWDYWCIKAAMCLVVWKGKGSITALFCVIEVQKWLKILKCGNTVPVGGCICLKEGTVRMCCLL